MKESKIRYPPDATLPIATIDTETAHATSDKNVGPKVSSEHLAAGRVPGLSEVECGLMIATNAFHRWMLRCMAVFAQPALSATKVAILHSTTHRGREKQKAGVMLVLDFADIHIVSYALKKLEAARLIHTRRADKGKMVAISQARLPEAELASLGVLRHMLSGTCNQAAWAAATF